MYSLSEKARVEVGKGRANALREYTYSPMAQAVVTPDGFLEYFLGFTKEQITLISAMRDKVISEEELTKVILDELTPPEPKVIPAGRPIPTKKSVTAQMKVSKTDWKKIYEDKGAHWMADLQPSQFAQEFAQKLIKTKKKSLLEIGCANGKDSILFAIAGLKVIGIDIVPEAIVSSKENAEKVGVEIDFQEGNVEKLTFEDASFDAVYSISVLHSTNMKKSVPEIARVLKSKGLALIYIYSGTEFIDGTEETTVTVDEFIELFKSNGFTITNFYTLQDEEFDEVGEKHSIIVIETKKK